MNAFLKKLFVGVSLICFAILFISCEKKEPETPTPPTPPVDTTSTSADTVTIPADVITTFAVGNEKGSKTSMKLNMSDKWTISNDQKWFKVSPISGFAGVNDITVEVLKDNKEVTEKVSTFDVKMKDKKISHYVIQDGKPCFNITASKLLFRSSTDVKEVQIESNIPFTISVDSDWIKTELEQPDSTLLGDNKTKSKYMLAKLSVKITDPSDESVYKGNIVIETPDVQYTIIVFRIFGEANFNTPDFNKQFLRASLFMKFTATWCGWCPMMSEALEKAMKAYPDHIVPFMLYSTDSDGGLGYAGTNKFYKKFKIGGYPTGVMNEYAVINNASGNDVVIENVAKEAVEKCLSKTAIAGTFLLDNGELKADLSIAAKETGDYKISAFVLENGIVAPQTNGGEDYVHNYVVRKEITSIWGDNITLSANQVAKLTLTTTVPDIVENVENISLVAFITYEGSFTGEVNKAEYINSDVIIDNVSLIDMESVTDFEYEK